MSEPLWERTLAAASDDSGRHKCPLSLGIAQERSSKISFFSSAVHTPIKTVEWLVEVTTEPIQFWALTFVSDGGDQPVTRLCGDPRPSYLLLTGPLCR
jgi:hypothetical protein